MAIPETDRPPLSAHARARAAVGLTLLALGLLGAFFFRTQVLRAGPGIAVAEGHRLRAIPLPAPRGTVFDRDGTELARSEPGTALILMPAPRDSLRARLDRVAALLSIPAARVDELARAVSETPRPIVVRIDLVPTEVAMLTTRQGELPGVLLEAWPRRAYPAGLAAEPVIGSIERQPWPAGTGENLQGPESGHEVGRTGLEAAFDSVLAGVPGLRLVEVDAEGALAHRVAADPQRVPEPGRALHTTLDADLQRRVAEVLQTRQPSAAVVLDIASGGILALHARTPAGTAGDPEGSLFAAVGRTRPPRAVFHAVSAALALEATYIDVQRPQAVPCRGGMRYGERYFRCWLPQGHGPLALADGLAEACDVYFYQIGLRLGLETMLLAGARMELDRPVGIGLGEERAGRYPTTVAALADRLDRAPNPADVLDLAAGRSPNETTLLQMTHVYAALARGGAAPRPHLVTGLPRDDAWRLGLSETTGRTLFGLLERVTAPGGAAGAVADHLGEGVRLRGQVTRARASADAPRENGWFVGVAGPQDGPDRIAIGVVVERALSDDQAAVLAGQIADYYLRNGAVDPGPVELPGTLTALRPRAEPPVHGVAGL